MGGWAIVVHGGAGVDPRLPEERQAAAKRILARCLEIGAAALSAGAAAVDVVEMVVRELETDPFFNSGRGSALTARGTVEMEASIMDGRDRRCGAVSGITTVKNPITLARRVMDFSPHSYLAFQGAEEFAVEQGVELLENDYFITDQNLAMLKLAKEANAILVCFIASNF
ncbi:probable isoaspartyl peptidase/L-asparaginase 2 [Phalaenopsis equestris]|uniref:probable isoaspartyl peptidase/L-asparaginase 2 n=1 Tax=Phalaenopsis equestris TaxID=78828 RepID=UPI0009E470A3|nr:probable isoaspartyl peptidase/L-asparaginase 2 [Phalaenopsis equestris]